MEDKRFLKKVLDVPCGTWFSALDEWQFDSRIYGPWQDFASLSDARPLITFYKSYKGRLLFKVSHL